MIVIIDYGMGNLKSVYNAFKKLELSCKISGEIEDINNADKLILPGVGAFKDAMENLQSLGLIEAIKERVNEGVPLLGICLGMQMLFHKGYEGEERTGLGLIKGEVRLMEPREDVKIPHIGWNNLEINNNNILLSGLGEDKFVYFVHSFMATEMEDEDLVAYAEYGNIKVPGLVCKGNVFGAQFHPEKSGEIGLNILKKFGEMV